MSEEREPAAEPASEDLDFEVEEPEVEEPEDDAGDDEPEDGGGRDDGAVEPEEVGKGDDARESGRVSVPRNRAADRIQQLTRERDEERARTAQFERQLQQLTQQATAADQQRIAAEEAERVKFMAPEERIVYETNKIRREMQLGLQQTQNQLWDRSDKGDYDRELDAKPKLAQFNARVDELHRQYPGVRRIDLLDKAIGEAARRNMGSARNRQERRAETAAIQQTAAPTGARAHVAAPRHPSSLGRRSQYVNLTGAPGSRD
jgi:hypothetical protein